MSDEEVKKDAIEGGGGGGEHHLITIAETNSELNTTKRVASLDIFRGLTVAVLFHLLSLAVDDAGAEWPKMGHAPWNGCNLADFVMPFFLFIVGMAIPLAFRKIRTWEHAIGKVIFRALKLLFWGLLLQGGYSHAPDKLTYGVDIKRIRWCGILQRIAFAYLVVSLVEIFTKDSRVQDLPSGRLSIFKMYCVHWMAGACVLIIYLAALYGTYVPDWHFTVEDPENADYGKFFTVTCGVRGKLDPPCNAVGYIDRRILGIHHIYQHPAWRRYKSCTENSPYEGPILGNSPSRCHAPFEPEGTLSSISAILSTIIGVHFGHVLVHLKDHSSRLMHWSFMGLAFLGLGIVLHFSDAIPLNKQLYTLSYVCVTSGAAALLLSSIYIMVDIWGLQYVFLPFKWIGMNAMFVYVMAAADIFADILDQKAYLRRNVAFAEGRHPTLRHICRDPRVGNCCRHSAQVQNLLEALIPRNCAPEDQKAKSWSILYKSNRNSVSVSMYFKFLFA